MTVLGIINDEMNSMGIPYEFMEWTEAVQYPYWVGEFSEVPTTTEDGFKETTLMLTGTTTGTWLELKQAQEKIERRFLHGVNYSTNDGSAVIYYENSFPVPTGEADLKRIQVNLKAKEWRNIQ